MEEARGSTERTLEQQALVDASEAGDRKTLKVDSYVPLTMAGIYLLLLLYFRSKGGYRPKDLASSGHH
jgi:DHA2 family metal-tetracycline-proton antiporter-like MFS transporter